MIGSDSSQGDAADGDSFDVVVVGSANLDLVVRSPRIPGPGETLIGDAYDEYPGGKGLNQAVAAARSGARVALVGAFGDDEAGARLRAIATDDGIDTASTPSVADTPTGRALITVSDGGENSIVVVPGANALVGTVGDIAAPTGAVVLAQLEIPIESVIRAFTDGRRRGATTVLNPAPAAALPSELLALTDVIIPNEHEVLLVGGVAVLIDAGVSTVIVTLGAAGVEVTTGVDSDTESDSTTTTTVRHPAIEVDVVDTTGAGDAFCGSLAARLAAGDQLDDAIRWAICAGGLATTRHGAVPSLATATEIRDRLSA